MGKYNKLFSDLAEKLLYNLLNESNEEVVNELNNKLVSMKYNTESLFKASEYIKTHFQGYETVELKSFNVHSIGDIFLKYPNKTIFFELKYCNNNKGTLKNPGAKFFNKFKDSVFNTNDNLGFNDYLINNNWYTTVYEILEKTFNKKINKRSDMYKLANELKSKAELDTYYKNIKEDIINKANEKKKEYIQYLLSHNINKQSLGSLCDSLLKDHFKINDIFKNGDKLFYIYADNKSNSFHIEEEIIDNNCEYDLVYQHGTNKLVVMKNEVEYMVFVPHFKNIFQGIKTPCFNVFWGKKN